MLGIPPHSIQASVLLLQGNLNLNLPGEHFGYCVICDGWDFTKEPCRALIAPWLCTRRFLDVWQSCCDMEGCFQTAEQGRAAAHSSLCPAACLLLQNQWETGANGQSHANQAIRMKSHAHERRKINPITVGIDLEIAVVLLIILIHNSAPHYKRWRGACPTFLFVIWQHFHWVALPGEPLVAPFPLLWPWTFHNKKGKKKSRKKKWGKQKKMSVAITAPSGLHQPFPWCLPTGWSADWIFFNWKEVICSY